MKKTTEISQQFDQIDVVIVQWIQKEYDHHARTKPSGCSMHLNANDAKSYCKKHTDGIDWGAFNSDDDCIILYPRQKDGHFIIRTVTIDSKSEEYQQLLQNKESNELGIRIHRPRALYHCFEETYQPEKLTPTT